MSISISLSASCAFKPTLPFKSRKKTAEAMSAGRKLESASAHSEYE